MEHKWSNLTSNMWSGEKLRILMKCEIFKLYVVIIIDDSQLVITPIIHYICMNHE